MRGKVCLSNVFLFYGERGSEENSLSPKQAPSRSLSRMVRTPCHPEWLLAVRAHLTHSCLPVCSWELPTKAYSHPMSLQRAEAPQSSGGRPATGSTPRNTSQNSRGRPTDRIPEGEAPAVSSPENSEERLPGRGSRHQGAGERPIPLSHQNLPPPPVVLPPSIHSPWGTHPPAMLIRPDMSTPRTGPHLRHSARPVRHPPKGSRDQAEA